jgi:hypothetical protein
MVDFEHLKFSSARCSFPGPRKFLDDANRRSVQETLERSLAAAASVAVVTNPLTIAATPATGAPV